MKYVDEYRDGATAKGMLTAIKHTITRPWMVMEICGGQTHTLLESGIESLLPSEVSMIHGPGCPVCVTPIELIDKAIAIAHLPEVILTSFGDMLRVPGSNGDLLRAKSKGADVRMLYSPLDALKLAQEHPEREVVFFAVGFETTAPVNALAVLQAHRMGLKNFSILCSHVLVPPAMEALLSAPDNRVQGFLAAGHVCTVMGYHEYEPIAERHRIPIVVTGFEPLDLLQGIYMVLRALEEGRYGVENQYSRVVTRAGNQEAQELLREVFEVCDRPWRGMGVIPMSGFRLQPKYASFDASRRFSVTDGFHQENSECIAGEILQGLKKPAQCAAFGVRCKPESPLGAPMVSAEGACAAYYRYGSQV